MRIWFIGVVTQDLFRGILAHQWGMGGGQEQILRHFKMYNISTVMAKAMLPLPGLILMWATRTAIKLAHLLMACFPMGAPEVVLIRNVMLWKKMGSIKQRKLYILLQCFASIYLTKRATLQWSNYLLAVNADLINTQALERADRRWLINNKFPQRPVRAVALTGQTSWTQRARKT